jgi:hypothetical protein
MSSTAAPFGLRPIYHPSGLIRPTVLTDGILSTYSTAILKGAAVKMETAGVIQAAAAGDSILGVFAGVEWTDTTGRARVSNYWPANTAYLAGSCRAYFYSDPQIVYEVQADGSLAQTSIGDETDLTNATAGSTTTGLSQSTVSTTLAGAGNGKTFRIINLASNADNAWGDAYTNVHVTINEHQYTAVVNAI